MKQEKTLGQWFRQYYSRDPRGLVILCAAVAMVACTIFFNLDFKDETQHAQIAKVDSAVNGFSLMLSRSVDRNRNHINMFGGSTKQLEADYQKARNQLTQSEANLQSMNYKTIVSYVVIVMVALVAAAVVSPHNRKKYETV